MRRAAALVALIPLVVTAPTETRRQQPAAFERVAAVVSERMKTLEVPGVSLAILHDGAVASRGFGVTNIDHPLPVTDRTLFQIGSISKTFTGTAIMRLVEQGKLRLDATVRTYLPDFAVRDAAASRDATVLDLLTHMGGWEGDVFEDTGDGADAVATYVANLKNVAQVAPLRTVWSYNNSGFVVAGRIVEVVTGKPFEDALRELVIAPLGLADTYITPAEVMTLRFASGHITRGGAQQVARPWPIGRYAHAAGGVISTPRDLVAYARFHMGSGAPLFSPETLRRMHATVLTKHGQEDEMAVTWHVSNEGGVRRLSHGGGTLGQQSNLVFVPERGFAVAITANAGGRIIQDVVRAAFKEYLAIDDRDPTPSATQPDVAAYAGRYSRPFADVAISVESGVMKLQVIPKGGFPNASVPVPPPGPSVPYAFFGKDTAIAQVPASDRQAAGRIQFIRAPDGTIGWVRVGSRIARKTAPAS